MVLHESPFIVLEENGKVASNVLRRKEGVIRDKEGNLIGMVGLIVAENGDVAMPIMEKVGLGNCVAVAVGHAENIKEGQD